MKLSPHSDEQHFLLFFFLLLFFLAQVTFLNLLALPELYSARSLWEDEFEEAQKPIAGDICTTPIPLDY